MKRAFDFLCGGYAKATSAIRAEVAMKYADAIRQADFWERRRIKREIDEEVKRRIEKEAPPDAMY